MEGHLQRALIEVLFAIAAHDEYRSQTASDSGAIGNDTVGDLLKATRDSLELLLRDGFADAASLLATV